MLAHFTFRKEKRQGTLLYKDGIVLRFHTSSGQNQQSYLRIIAKEAQRNYSKMKVLILETTLLLLIGI